MATLTILGSGTSDGVPQLGCTCPVCTSSDPRDRRLRTSALIRHEGKNILLDCGPDFREQAFRCGITHIDAILCTHHHFDHLTGLGELRPLSSVLGQSIAVYALPATIEQIYARFPYAFREDKCGGGYPSLELIPVQEVQEIAGLTVRAFTVMHGNLPIAGFRIGNLTYITDAKSVPEQSKALVRKSEILVVNALHEKPHSTHFCIAEASAFAKEMEIERCFLIHLSHRVSHAECEKTLPKNIRLAYDGLSFEFAPQENP